MTGITQEFEAIDKVIYNYNCRSEERMEMIIPLLVRRPINGQGYWRQVATTNVSKRGAALVLDVPLEVGAILEVSDQQQNFIGRAIVRHTIKRVDDYWEVGVQFLSIRRYWVGNF